MNRNSGIEDNLGHRISIFVDVQDIYKNAKRYKSAKLNYAKFLEWAAGGCSVVYAGAYVMVEEDIENERKFLDALRLNGYDIRTKKMFLGTNPEGKTYIRNSWSLGISLDISQHCEKVDTIIIVSSSRDFIDTCYFFRSKVRIEIASIRESTDKLLMKSATDFNAIPDNCFMKIEG